MNKIPIKNRLKELVVDYFIIIAYLVMLFIVNLGIFFFIIKGFPDYTEIQAQLIATSTSVIPIILIFSYLDYFKKGSIGKKVSGLKLTYTNYKFSLSILRNSIKFLLWQLGHAGVIHGVYYGIDITEISMIKSLKFIGLILLIMVLYRKDKRHLAELIAGTNVELQ